MLLTYIMKKLIIIAGITGSIGQELARKHISEKDTLVYGISRKGVSMDLFEELPTHHAILNVDMNSEQSMQTFLEKIPNTKYTELTYYHLLGEFKTEINNELNVIVENDLDKDGIDDTVHKLVSVAYNIMTTGLINKTKTSDCNLNIISFGSLADRYEIPCFHSFRKSREQVIEFSKKQHLAHQNVNFYLFNTSTLFAVDEILERPFIFGTNVNPDFWITPVELVNKTLEYTKNEKGFIERDIFLKNPDFSTDYWDPNVTYKRRVKELYNINI